MMWCKKLPKHQMAARTIFIPKKLDDVDPADLRSIVIFSSLALA